MLIAYASMSRILADQHLAGRLHIRPRAIFTSSEVLTEETRRRIVQAWGERLFNQYAATECGSLAAECDHHRGMHLMEDLVIVEVETRTTGLFRQESTGTNSSSLSSSTARSR